MSLSAVLAENDKGEIGLILYIGAKENYHGVQCAAGLGKPWVGSKTCKILLTSEKFLNVIKNSAK